MCCLAKVQAAGCYVHVPFCMSKCRYCAFYSATSRHEMAHWVDSVLCEAEQLGPLFGSFDTLYLGGGTPSVLSDELLARLLDGLRRRLQIHDKAEVTIELNPGDVDLIRARTMKTMGIVRASVGVQSFDNAVLRFLGRRHDRVRAIAVLDDLRSAGFDNLGIDLICGIPDQTQ